MAQQRDDKGRFVAANGARLAPASAGGKGKTGSGKAGAGKRRNRRRPLILIGAGQGSEKVIRLEQARSTSFTATRKARFLTVLSETSNVRAAAAAAGITAETAYKHRRRDAAFARGWEKALADAIADLKMLVAHQGRFGAIDEVSTRTDAEGGGGDVAHSGRGCAGALRAGACEDGASAR